MELLQSIDIALAFCEFGNAFFEVVGVDYDVGLVALGKGIHILDKDVVFGQVVEDLRE